MTVSRGVRSSENGTLTSGHPADERAWGRPRRAQGRFWPLLAHCPAGGWTAPGHLGRLSRGLGCGRAGVMPRATMVAILVGRPGAWAPGMPRCGDALAWSVGAAEIGVRGSGSWCNPGFQTQRPGSSERDPALLLDTEWAFIHAAKTAACPLAKGVGRRVGQPAPLSSIPSSRGEVEAGPPLPCLSLEPEGEVLRWRSRRLHPSFGLHDPWSVPILPLRASSFKGSTYETNGNLVFPFVMNYFS